VTLLHSLWKLCETFRDYQLVHMDQERVLLSLQRLLAPGQLQSETQLVACLDARELNVEVFSTLWESLAATVSSINPRLLQVLEAELRALLRLLYFAFSVGVGRPFPGDVYQNLTYRVDVGNTVSEGDSVIMTRGRRFLYGCAYVLGHYLLERYQTMRYTDSPWVPSASSAEMIDNLLKSMESLNFFLFFLMRKYRNPLERIFRLRLRRAETGATRALSFEMLNRQLVWEGFTELAISVIPILQSPLLHRILRKAVFHGRFGAASREVVSQEHSGKIRCRLCGKSRPLMPHILIPCRHLFCYVCMAMKIRTNGSEGCPYCGSEFERAESVIPSQMVM
jgi:peroxin-2